MPILQDTGGEIATLAKMIATLPPEQQEFMDALMIHMVETTKRISELEAFAERVQSKANECAKRQMVSGFDGQQIYAALQFGALRLRGLGEEAAALLAKGE